MAKIACPKCNSKKLSKLQSGKRRYARCKYEFIPHKLPFAFSRMNGRRSFIWFSWNKVRIRYPNRLGLSNDGQPEFILLFSSNIYFQISTPLGQSLTF